MDSSIQNEAIRKSQVAVRQADIQLTGKHLAFLFMAAAVVSVVIFLGGVIVGRTGRRPAQARLTIPASTAPAKMTTQAAVPAREAELKAPAWPPTADSRSGHLETTSPSPEHLESVAAKTGTPSGRRRGTGHRRTRSHAAHRGRSGPNGH